MKKKQVQEVLDQLPDSFSLDELIERLILLESFEKGREQYEQDKVVSHEEVGKHLYATIDSGANLPEGCMEDFEKNRQDRPLPFRN